MSPADGELTKWRLTPEVAEWYSSRAFGPKKRKRPKTYRAKKATKQMRERAEVWNRLATDRGREPTVREFQEAIGLASSGCAQEVKTRIHELGLAWPLPAERYENALRRVEDWAKSPTTFADLFAILDDAKFFPK